MNKILKNYIFLSFYYGFLLNMYDIINNDTTIIPFLFIDKIIWITGFTLISPFWIPLFTYEYIRYNEIYLRNISYYDVRLR